MLLDKYDLLRWQVNDTLEEVIDNNIDYLPWQSIMKLFIYEVDANRRYYFECLSQHEVDVSDLFALHLAVLLAHIMDGKTEQKQKSSCKYVDNLPWNLQFDYPQHAF